MIRAMIIDDEPAARQNLNVILQRYCAGDVTVVGEAAGVQEAYTLIQQLAPNLLFLDIEMGKETGFDLVAMFDQPGFQVVFVTAYDQYAIKAIKINALDYLLKPLSIQEVRETVQKALLVAEGSQDGRLQNLLNIMHRKNSGPAQIAIASAGGYKMVVIDEICYLRAEKEYTYIHCLNGDVHCSSSNLGHYEDLLSGHAFFRLHHSYIVNRASIKEYQKGEGGEVLLYKGEHLPVSRRRRTAFLAWLRL